MKFFIICLLAFFIAQQNCLLQKRQSIFSKIWPFGTAHQRFIQRENYLNGSDDSFFHKFQTYITNILINKTSEVTLVKKPVKNTILEDFGLKTFSF